MNATSSVHKSMSRPSRTTVLPSLGLLLVTGGFLLLCWVLYLWVKPLPSPYTYRLVEERVGAQLSNLHLEAWPDLKVGKYELHVASLDKPVAVAYETKNAVGNSILLNWENLVSEPIVTASVDFSELITLASDIAKHVPKDAIILGWWDTSRQLKLLSGRDTLFTSYLAQPLIVPSYWKDRSDVIAEYERQFWGPLGSAEEQDKFKMFADALSSEASKGATMLKAVAGSREAYIIVHPADLYKLAMMYPERIDLAFKDFPLTGNVHGLAGQVKGWMKENGYNTYTLQSLNEKSVRAYFLNETEKGKVLLSHMLPLMNSTPVDFEALQVVHKQGGYWVFKIPSA
ncbi:MAG: hydroxylamine oxidation protein HaoB [Nitrospira sp.]|nr:hydroxylamine oxidation protein HaoB [Nitrospira sp.]